MGRSLTEGSEDRTDDPAWGSAAPAETRWASAISVVFVMGLQLLLPDRLSLGPLWLAPAIELAILFTLVVVGPSRLDAEARDLRGVALGLVGVLITANSVTLVIIIRNLLRTGGTVNGRTLIYSAVAVWFTAIVAFGILYWEMDRGGPIQRSRTDHAQPDFLFPQMSSPTSTAEPWSPRYVDYLYLSLTNSTAFSPTDALPLTRRAKAVMAAQSLASLGTIVIVGARAVNILN